MAYDIALFFHITGVVTLFIAAALEITSLYQMRRARSVQEARIWSSLIPPLEPAFPLAVVVIIAAGLFMLHDQFTSAQPWALTVLVVTILLAILGGAFNGRRMTAIHRGLQSASDGPIPDEIDRRIQDSALLTSIQTMAVMILGAVLIMTVKPGLRDSLIIVVVFGLLGLAATQLMLRARSRRTAAVADLAGQS